MKRVVIESPLNAVTRELIEDNKLYAKTCVRDSLRRGEAPYASHLFFDQQEILDDMNPEERELGIKAGFAWGEAAEAVVFYVDRGLSPGMLRGFERAMETDADILVRSVITRQELTVPINPQLTGTQFEEMTKKQNLNALERASAIVIGDVF